MYEGFKIIDADAHFLEPMDMWDRYVEEEFYDHRPKVIAHAGRSRLDYDPDGVIFTKSRLDPGSAKRFRDMEKKYGQAYQSWWSLESRLQDMDRFGWDLQVCLGTNGRVGAEVSRKDVKLGAALCRAFNNWCHDYCQGDPQRVKFVSTVPGGDVEEEVVEARRSVEDLGAVGIILSTAAPGKMWHYPDYDPLWQTAVELDFPVALHGGGTLSGEPESYARYQGMGGPFGALTQAIEFPVENMISLGHFMFSGILDRFPNLRVSILESNCGWLPFWLSRLEKRSEGRQSNTFDADSLQATPKEYFLRQCFIACDADEIGVKFCIEHVGDNNIVFNTDYPHFDAPNPWEVVPQMVEQPISNESKGKIFWDNAVRL